MSLKKTGIHALKLCAAVLLLAALSWPQQALSNFDRERAQEILQVVAGEVRKHYYDPGFHGVNWDAQVAEAKQKIEKATSFNMAMSHIAAALDTLHDSHTFLLPPQHANRYDYGWQYQMVGDRCYVTRIRPGSDAESKGVKRGDEVLSINGYGLTRDNLWKVQYVFSTLRPQPGFRLELQDPAGRQRQVDIAAKIHEGQKVTDLTGRGGGQIWDFLREQENQEHLMRARFVEYGDKLLVLKMPEFLFSRNEVDAMIGKARKYENLVVDLRGNPGGSVETLKAFVAGMFDKDVKIADRNGRKETRPEVAKTEHNPFTGKLVVLVDARSASAAELFARVVQLEKRGVVIGDQTSGAVMESRHYDEHLGDATRIFYGASVTEWNLIMADGKSLEHTGVTPDEIILPTAQDIANGRDPVLARAGAILGINVAAGEAGKAFPYEWPRE